MIYRLGQSGQFRAQELCESRGVRLWRPVPNSPYGLYGRQTSLVEGELIFRAQELCESRGGCPWRSVPNSSYGLCGRKATLGFNRAVPEREFEHSLCSLLRPLA